MFSMDSSTSFMMTGLLFFTLGVVVGCIAAYLLIGRQDRTRELEAELGELRERFADYRIQVTGHFMHTSELLQEMTRSYRAVYEHLGTGAQQLCDNDLEAAQLELPQKSQLADAGQDTYTAEIIADLSERAEHLEELIGEAPRISDLDIKAETEDLQRVQH